jgi:hypothetical protein
MPLAFSNPPVPSVPTGAGGRGKPHCGSFAQRERLAQRVKGLHNRTQSMTGSKFQTHHDALAGYLLILMSPEGSR